MFLEASFLNKLEKVPTYPELHNKLLISLRFIKLDYNKICYDNVWVIAVACICCRGKSMLARAVMPVVFVPGEKIS